MLQDAIVRLQGMFQLKQCTSSQFYFTVPWFFICPQILILNASAHTAQRHVIFNIYVRFRTIEQDVIARSFILGR